MVIAGGTRPDARPRTIRTAVQSSGCRREEGLECHEFISKVAVSPVGESTEELSSQ